MTSGTTSARPRRHEFYLGAVDEIWLPSDFANTTQYEFRHPTFPICSITVDRVGFETAAARAYLRQRRERMISLTGANASAPEVFENDALLVEGCVLDHDSWDGRQLYLLALETHPTFLMLLVEVRREAAGLVRALAERVVEQEARPEALPGWSWRAVDNAWIPVPEGASDPGTYFYATGDVELTIERGEPGELPAFPPLSGNVVPSEPLRFLTWQNFPLTLAAAEGKDEHGVDLLIASALVDAGPLSVRVQAQARGASSQRFKAELPQILASIRIGALPSKP
jgi:hypothetical protein